MSEERVWVNFTLTGEPARIIREAKRRRSAKSTRDAVVQALLLLGDKMSERDLKAAQITALEEGRIRTQR